MAKQTIGIGSVANDGTGDTLRVAGDKINDNFDELYAADAALGTAAALDVDVDDTLAADSDSLVPSQQAVKAYVDAVAGGGVTELDDIGDVNAPTPTAGDVLTWDDTPGEWVPAAPSGGGAFALDDATDVDAPSPSDGDVLTFDSGSGDWVPAAPSGGGGTATQIDADSVITTFSFTSIGGSYKRLAFVGWLTIPTNATMIIRVNNDSSGVAGTSGKYQMQRSGHNNGAINLQQLLQTGWNVHAATMSTGVALDFELVLGNYASGNKKMARMLQAAGTTTTGQMGPAIYGLLWDNAAAITQVDFIFTSAPTGGNIRLEPVS